MASLHLDQIVFSSSYVGVIIVIILDNLLRLVSAARMMIWYDVPICDEIGG